MKEKYNYVKYADYENYVEEYLKLNFSSNLEEIPEILSNYYSAIGDDYNEVIFCTFGENIPKTSDEYFGEGVAFYFYSENPPLAIIASYKEFLFSVNKICKQILKSDNEVIDKDAIEKKLNRMFDEFYKDYGVTKEDILSRTYYLDDDGNSVDEKDATTVIVRQYDEDGNHIGNAYLDKSK